MQPKDASVSYELAYPGLLPNHPLYVFKQIRDGFTEFMTRDQMKKARLRLQMSDKMTRAAQILIHDDKKNVSLTLKQLNYGEEYFAKTIADIKTSSKQGVKPTKEFLDQLNLSLIKHKKVIEDIKTSAPQQKAKLQLLLDQYDRLEQSIKTL
jgi:CRISPR/Cas system-associated exonuclease Cas4 (RecB family)